MSVIEYVGGNGRSPFEAWFSSLDPIAAAKVRVSLTRLEAGNVSNVKSVGEGVLSKRSISGRATASTSVETAIA